MTLKRSPFLNFKKLFSNKNGGEDSIKTLKSVPDNSLKCFIEENKSQNYNKLKEDDNRVELDESFKRALLNANMKKDSD